MDKVSIRLEITCSQLVKDYYGKQSALTKCNFLLPSSTKNPLDFFPSIGKSINYICSWTYANVVSTLWKLEVVPGRGRDRREPHALQTQPRLEKPPCIWRHFDHTAQPWGKTDDWAGKEKTSSSKSSSYSQQGKVTIAWAWCSPSPPSPLTEQSLCTDWEALRGEALPSHPFTLLDDTPDCQSCVCLLWLYCMLFGEVTTKKMADPLALPWKQEFLVHGSVRTREEICCCGKSFLLI